MIITQPKELIGAFVNVMQGVPQEASWGPNYNAMGLVRSGKLVAGLIYNGYEGANVNMHIGAIVGAKWLNKEFLFAAFDYPFNELGKRRATAFMASTNKRTIKFVKNLGFVYEGTMPHYYVDDDAVVYGLLRENCRFLFRKAA